MNELTMSLNDTISEFIAYGFERHGVGFGIVLFGTAMLISSGMIPWLSDRQKRGVRGYLDAQNDSRPPTKEEEFYHSNFLTFKAGIFIVALGVFFILFQPKLIF
ncbi:hypothetical protein RO575_03225 [Methylomonas sp. MO1]|uniref:hypothetical protein n=2 Tax=unclassified Methylomonas TaxID=2608980 RepID=UPI0028A34897|nr:hypothetical protein [Methylomonas sp. MO1]MDT4288558.1 hypothetical protein [Methylomonas sp. MO1]